jgi:ribosomal protein L18E
VRGDSLTASLEALVLALERDSGFPEARLRQELARRIRTKKRERLEVRVVKG